jgi:hypothetical protein
VLNRQILGVILAMALVAGTLGILANVSVSTDPYLTAVLTVRKAGSDQQ